MVAHPGAETRPAALQPLNAPQPVKVMAGPDGRPDQIGTGSLQPGNKGGRRRHPGVPASRRDESLSPSGWTRAAAVEDMWKVVDEWWRGPGHEVRRTYYSLLLEDGRRLTVFHDAVRGEWMRQSD